MREKRGTSVPDATEHHETPTVSLNKAFVPPSPAAMINHAAEIDAAVIQLWEGLVLEIDAANDLMQVLLTSKLGQIPDHTAEIELQWVSDQDRDLVVPGAVFYLTLYKQTRRGSIQNSQELRFRRRPAWSKRQVQGIYSDADLMLAKMRARPVAE